MRHLEFYDQGVRDARGRGRLLVPARRLLRRILRPMFQAQVALYRELFERDDQLGQRVGDLERTGYLQRIQELEQRDDQLVQRISELERANLAHRMNELEQREPRLTQRLDDLDRGTLLPRMDRIEQHHSDLQALARRLAAIEDRLFSVMGEHTIPIRHSAHVAVPAPHRSPGSVHAAVHDEDRRPATNRAE